MNIQADLLSHLDTRVVVPLLPPDQAPRPARWLNPRFEVSGRDVLMVTQFMAAVPTSVPKPPVASLSNHHTEIVGAIDMLMQGF